MIPGARVGPQWGRGLSTFYIGIEKNLLKNELARKFVIGEEASSGYINSIYIGCKWL